MNTLPVVRVRPGSLTFDELFGIDLRTLAAFRMAAASVLLFDIWHRSQDLTAFFTDAGLLPRVARIELWEAGQYGFQHQWSLHMLSGTWWSQFLMLLVSGWFGLWLLVGYRTRLAAVISWVLLMSLDARNPLILNSGDVLLRSMLLWSLFLPLGARWSVDSRRRDAEPRPQRIVAAASVALLLQLCLMYWFSVACKMKPVEGLRSPWTQDFSAVYYALNVDGYATRFGIWLRQFPRLMQALTVGSVLLEALGPVLVFIPWGTRWWRLGVIAAFTLFHLGLGLCLTVGLFPAICIASWLVFVPGAFWDAWEQRTAAWRQGLTRRAAAIARRLRLHAWRWFEDDVRVGLRRPSSLHLRLRRWGRIAGDCGIATLFLYVVVWNVRELDFRHLEPRTMSRQWNGPARILGLDQNWSMFAPLPRTEDGWLVMKGTLRDGSEVTQWDFDQPLPWSKPALVSATFRTENWRKYLDNLTTEPYAGYRMYLCNWLAARWNAARAVGHPDREVHKVEIIHRVELTPPPGNPLPDPETKILWTWYYE